MSLVATMLEDISYEPSVDEAWDSNLRGAWEVESSLFRDVWQHSPEGAGLLSQWSLADEEREKLRSAAKTIWMRLEPLVTRRADEGGSGVYMVTIGHTTVGYVPASDIKEARTIGFYLFQWLTNLPAKSRYHIGTEVVVRLVYGPGIEMLEVCLKKLDERSMTSVNDSTRQLAHHAEEVEFWTAVRSMIHTGSV